VRTRLRLQKAMPQTKQQDRMVLSVAEAIALVVSFPPVVLIATPKIPARPDDNKSGSSF
jgi:hypothetical protein